RIEAVFNLDPIRQFTVPMGTEQIAFQRRSAQEQQQQASQQQPRQSQFNEQQPNQQRLELQQQQPGNQPQQQQQQQSSDRRQQLSRYFRGFQTSVTMGRLRTVSVHVVGEVCQPGAYTLSALSTVTNALFSAGGPTKLGTLRDVRLIRGTSQVAKLDLYDFLQRGDRTRDYRLESGDTIFVPTIGDVVAVAGEVKRPA